MKRHPSLAGLSGEHHTALVLARGLRSASPAALRGGLPAGGQPLVDTVQARFARELAPHFAIEERELLPLSDCGTPALRRHALRIRQEHAQLRALVASLTADNVRQQGDALGALLTAHVRFEERSWFPALEAEFGPFVLQALARRLQLEPQSLICGYHKDEQGAWVAELDCGHMRHVRHDPPWQSAPWVTTEAGRAGKLHHAVACLDCRMPRMPPCARVYKRTEVFDARSVPAGLLRSHTLRADCWGRIVVEEGRVGYVLEDEDDLHIQLRPRVAGNVAPERPHHVEPSDDARFHVEFLRCEPAQLRIRDEGAADHAAIANVHTRAFGRRDEATMVEAVRALGQATVSLAAEEQGAIVGHVLLSPVTLDGRAKPPGLGLAPMAVDPDHQHRGIGAALVDAALQRARALGFSYVVVLGHPRYYPRFGFTAASRYGLRYEPPVPEEAWMALELAPGALEGQSGTVRYLPPFE